MEELPETIQVSIRNNSTNRSKDLIVYVSDDVNLYQHIYDNPSVHGAYVRTWSPNVVSAVKDGTSTVVCSIENTPIVLSLTQMKNTTTKQLYHDVAKVGSLSNIRIILNVVQSDSLADEITDDEPGETHQYPLVEEIPSESILSNAIQTMNIKIQNQFTMRSTVMDIRISQDVYIFDEIYDNPALLHAQIRDWSSDIVTGIKNESKAIVASVSGTQVRISIAKMKMTSTKQLHGFVSQAAPRQHPQLVLGIVESDQIPDIDARFDVQEASTSKRHNKLETLQTKEEKLDDTIEIGASDLDNSVNFEKEHKSKISESQALAANGDDEETMQGSTDIETDSSIHEDDDTVVAGNETPKTSPRPEHQISPNHQIPSMIMGSKDEMENAKDEDTAFIAALDFERPHDIERKTAYDDFFAGDQAGFEITIDHSINKEFRVSIAEERLEVSEDYPNPCSRPEQENETENSESFDKSNKPSAEMKNFSTTEEIIDAIDNQIEIEASFIPRPHVELGSVGVGSLAQTIAVVVHCQGEDESEENVAKEKETARIASTKIQSLVRGNAVRSSQSLRHDQALVVHCQEEDEAEKNNLAKEKETERIASTKIQSLVRGNAVRLSQSLRHDRAASIQAAFRGYQARVLCKHDDISGVGRVQRLGRRWLTKQMQMKRELAASKIPQAVRSRASQKIAYFQRQRAKMQNSQEDMACKIQSAYRGHIVRRDIDSKHAATTCIQSVCRKWLACQKVAKVRAEKETLSMAEEEARANAEEEARLTVQAEVAEDDDDDGDEEASLQATLIRLKAKEDVRIKAEEEARSQAAKEARVAADAQAKALAKAEKAIAALEAEEEALLEADEEAIFASLGTRAASLDDSYGFEVEYTSASSEQQQDDVQEDLNATVAKDVKSSTMMQEDIESISDSKSALEKSRSSSNEIDGCDEGGNVVVQLISSVLESPEAHTETQETQARKIFDVEEHQGDDGVSHMDSKAASKIATSEAVAKISEDDTDSKASKMTNATTGNESRKQETDSLVSKSAVHTTYSCETFGIDNTNRLANNTVSTEANHAAPTDADAVVPDDTQSVVKGGQSNRDDMGAASIAMVTMAGVCVNNIGSEAPNVISEEKKDREKNREQKDGVSISSQDSHADTNSNSLDTLDMLVMGLKKKRDRLRESSNGTASNNQKTQNSKTEEKSDRKFASVPSSQASHTDTNSTSLDTLDRMVLGVDNNSNPAASSHSSERRDESVAHNSKPKTSTSHGSAMNREQVLIPKGSKDGKIESLGSSKASSTVPLPSIVTTRNKEEFQTSQAASVCSSLNTFPSYYEKFDRKIGSQMVLKALHAPVSEAKTSQDVLTLSDDDQSSKPEASSLISNAASKDDIITLTARYEEFAKQLKSLVAQATMFHQAISEKEKARTKFFEECASMTDGTPLHLDVSKNEIPESANISYARAQVEDLNTPRSMSSVQALAQIYSSSSVTEYQQEILAYVTAWTEAVTSKVEAELQTYDKLEEQLYHYEVKVDELRKKNNGSTSTRLTRNYKKLAVAGQKRDQQLGKACYLLKAVVDNSWKDLYPLVEQTMIWETNRRDGQVDTIGMMLPKTMVNMKQNIKSGKTMPAPEQESLEAELATQTRENMKLQYRINKLEAILQSGEGSSRNKPSTFNFRPAVARKTAE